MKPMHSGAVKYVPVARHCAWSGAPSEDRPGCTIEPASWPCRRHRLGPSLLPAMRRAGVIKLVSSMHCDILCSPVESLLQAEVHLTVRHPHAPVGDVCH